MSRRPGIGKPWLDRYQKDVLSQDSIIMRGGLQLRPPKYYDKLYESSNPNKMEEIKKKRMLSVNHEDNSYQRLEVKEKLQKIRFKMLKRGIETC